MSLEITKALGIDSDCYSSALYMLAPLYMLVTSSIDVVQGLSLMDGEQIPTSKGLLPGAKEE
jgi:hypothetical protein